MGRIIAELFNRSKLPQENVASPHITLGAEIEVDVVAMESDAGMAEAHSNAPLWMSDINSNSIGLDRSYLAAYKSLRIRVP